MWTTIVLIIVSLALVGCAVMWYLDNDAYDKRIQKLQLRMWYLEMDNKDLKYEVKRLRELIKEEKEE